MASATRSIVVGIAALALLTGCAEPAPQAPSASPSATASATPTPTATPTATPTPTPTPTPAASATPTATASADWPRCADGVVVSQHLATTVSWSGTWEEQVARSAPQPGFEPAGLLSSDGVLCAVTYLSPIDGSPGVITASTAIVRDPDLQAALDAWAAENGYTAHGEAGDYVEHVSDPDPTDALLDKFHVTSLADPIYLDAYRLDSGLDLQPTDMVLHHWHMDGEG